VFESFFRTMALQYEPFGVYNRSKVQARSKKTNKLGLPRTHSGCVSDAAFQQKTRHTRVTTPIAIKTCSIVHLNHFHIINHAYDGKTAKLITRTRGNVRT
jgi:hypothetical protein